MLWKFSSYTRTETVLRHSKGTLSSCKVHKIVLILFARLQVLDLNRSQHPDMAFAFQVPGRTIG